jgi:hypothetical protein
MDEERFENVAAQITVLRIICQCSGRKISRTCVARKGYPRTRKGRAPNAANQERGAEAFS